MSSIKVLASANAMKGSLSAKGTSEAMISGAKSAIEDFGHNSGKNLNAEFVFKPIADGGDDTLDVISECTRQETVVGPLHAPVEAAWGSLGDTAVIEMSKASGIALVPPEELDPFKATTYGTGQLIHAAIEAGFKKVLVTIGGSATVDCGIGALSALGAKFYDGEGKEVKPYGNKALGEVRKADFSAFEKIKDVEFSIACDVDNVLLGSSGSAAIFGPQKLAPRIREDKNSLTKAVEEMEKNIENFANVVEKETGKNVRDVAGSGAAGGFVVGFVTALNATLKPGAELILNMLKINDHEDADLVFTSEGMCDVSTLNNKAPYSLIKRMKRSHVVVLTGAIQNEEVEKALYQAGASLVLPIEDRTMTLNESMQNAENLIRRASYRATYSFLKSHF